MKIAGGLYREICEVPRWSSIFGSGGRAAAAISAMSPGSTLHTYGDIDRPSDWSYLNDLGIKVVTKQALPRIAFSYFHPLSRPYIEPALNLIIQQPPLRVEGRTVLRFGMLEGDAIVKSNRAIYDPQGASTSTEFFANGSSANDLALALNENEAQMMGGEKSILAKSKASIVIIKRGPRGASVLGQDFETFVPAYRSNRVFKIGSGDVFSAIFAHYWGEMDLPPIEAADIASRTVAAYCNSMALPVSEKEVGKFLAARMGLPRSIRLEGVTNTIGRRYAMEEARFRLRELGVPVNSPALGDRGYDQEPAAVLLILDGYRTPGDAAVSHRPIVVLDEEGIGIANFVHDAEVMVTSDFATALYWTAWEATDGRATKE